MPQLILNLVRQRFYQRMKKQTGDVSKIRHISRSMDVFVILTE